jgi:hypothetical protein
MFSVKNKQQTILLINKIQNERNREKGNVLREIIRSNYIYFNFLSTLSGYNTIFIVCAILFIILDSTFSYKEDFDRRFAHLTARYLFCRRHVGSKFILVKKIEVNIVT